MKRSSPWILQSNSKSFVSIYIVEYNKVTVKLSDSHLDEPISAVKNQTKVTLRTGVKMFEGYNWTIVDNKAKN